LQKRSSTDDHGDVPTGVECHLMYPEASEQKSPGPVAFLIGHRKVPKP
jgi:hypothetical protein